MVLGVCCLYLILVDFGVVVVAEFFAGGLLFAILFDFFFFFNFLWSHSIDFSWMNGFG
jgi:hypothetical protein